MIPSLYPVREQVEAYGRARRARGVGLPWQALLDEPKADRVDPKTGLKIKSIYELLNTASKVRYADTPWIDYPALLAREFAAPGSTPVTLDGSPLFGGAGAPRPRIAVIGGGMSGLLCGWQLAKLGAHVDIHEAAPAPNGDAAAPQGAGRIRPVNVVPDNPATRAELGAMRFPDTAYLFWHYIALALDDAWTAQFVEFPNPGKVPTLLTGEKLLSGLWRTAQRDVTTQDDEGFNLNDIYVRHINAFLNIEAGGYTVGEVAGYMIDGTAAAAPWIQAGVDRFWQAVSARYYRTSYRQFLEESGLFTADEIRIIGYLGLGTGGFSPLFDTCVLDILRLFLWDYAAEYAVPDLYKLPFGLLQGFKRAAQQSGGEFFEKSPVDYVAYSKQTQQYTLVRGDQPVGAPYDYVVAATSHAALQALIDNAPAQLPPAVSAQAPDAVCPFSPKRSPTSSYFADVRGQQGVSSIKIFQSMAGPATPPPQAPQLAYPYVAPGVPTAYQDLVRVAFGNGADDAPLGVTYVLPWLNTDFPASPLASALHYSWGRDSETLRFYVAEYNVPVTNALKSVGVFIGRDTTDSSEKRPALGLAEIKQAYASTAGDKAAATQSVPLTGLVATALNLRFERRQQTPDCSAANTFATWFFPFPPFSPEPAVGQGYLAVVDWAQVPYVNLGFKLDAPGRGYPSIYRFSAQQNAKPDILDTLGRWETPDAKVCDSSVSKFYFCGDSFSNFGGWVEGAFQSALNVVAAIACRERREAVDPQWRRVLDLAPEPFPAHLYPNGPTDA